MRSYWAWLWTTGCLLVACVPAALPAPRQAEPTTITLPSTDYVRFEFDGVTYHAVPVQAGGYLLSSPHGHRLDGPTYIRREGEELWQCYPKGYQIPAEASIILSGTRAPVTITTLDVVCR